ncbi:MAG: DUF3291 domain-containing protein [Hyphomicrobiales bacterium]
MSHIAELNLSEWKIDANSDAARGFLDNVDKVNAVADRAKGFVWRLLDEQRDEFGRNPVCDTDNVLMTLSVWESAEDLEDFVWNTVHKRIYNRKNDWFGKMTGHELIMWWVDEGDIPTLENARERMDHLNEFGNTDFAFGWDHLDHVKLWQKQQCG